jgi:hypothetical protein
MEERVTSDTTVRLFDRTEGKVVCFAVSAFCLTHSTLLLSFPDKIRKTTWGGVNFGPLLRGIWCHIFDILTINNTARIIFRWLL